MILGIFEPIFYVLFCVIIYIAYDDLSTYRSNPFEIDARIRTGQMTISDLAPERNGDHWPRK